MITWKFETHNITFKSKPENLDRDRLRMAFANEINLDTKIIILDGNIDQPLPSNDVNSNGDTSVAPESTLSGDSPKRKSSKQKTTELSSVPGDLDNVDSDLNNLGLHDSGNDSGEFSDWFDSQRV